MSTPNAAQSPDVAFPDVATNDRFWNWRGQSICYRTAGNLGDRAQTAVLLIHGFGASVGHWRKNMPALATQHRVYALDLLGFGASSKPLPTGEMGYTFATWGQQIGDFCREVIGSPAVLVGNSIGAIAAMQSAVMAPDLVPKVILLNCSLRLLHEEKRQALPWYERFGSTFMQQILGNRAIVRFFFDRVRTPASVRQILNQAYARKDAITDELVEILLAPARDPHAVDVFAAFVRYSQGPTPEALLAQLPCDAIVMWGEKDPWEPIELGRAFQQFACVKEFIAIADAGHCPHDEAPEVVNPLLLRYV